MFRRMWLSVSLAVLGHACGGSAPSATEVSREGTAQCPTIREVDWLNRSYDFGFAGVQRVTNGRHVQGEGEEGMEIHSSAQGPLYGDLTGDGVDEAVMALDTFDGGNDPPRWLEVYTVRDCEVVRLGVVPASLEGDEYNSLIGEGIEGGRLVVERQDWSDGGAHCCAHHIRTEQWVIRNAALVEDDAARTLRQVRTDADD
ncbi:MAG: hypothetical protein IPH72_19215 [Sandaracinaceae bacterium]|jgi:hypothetical protein|nr:hypothetical protein [Sandaracinaceae bacterium]